jgi:nucleoside-diphosphate-sugar epimerase
MSANAPGIFRGKRLVVFGAGYVGGTVAREAVRLGLRVTTLTRNSGTARALVAEGIEVVTAELSTDGWHARIPGGADFVLNCVSSGGGGAEAYRRSYVDGMQSVLAWAKSSGGVGTLLYTSSTSVYPQSGGARVDEQASNEGASETAQILLEAENLLRAASAEVAQRWFILRLAGIYGPGRHSLLDHLRVVGTEFRGRGDHRLNLIHRDDIIAAILTAFAAPPKKITNEILNLADDGAATKAEVAGWLAEQLGCRAPSFTGAPMAGRRDVAPDRVIANDKIKAVLGWRPHYPDFRAGYRAILEA